MRQSTVAASTLPQVQSLTRQERLTKPPKRLSDQPPSLSSAVWVYSVKALRVCALSWTISTGMSAPVRASSPKAVLATSRRRSRCNRTRRAGGPRPRPKDLAPMVEFHALVAEYVGGVTSFAGRARKPMSSWSRTWSTRWRTARPTERAPVRRWPEHMLELVGQLGLGAAASAGPRRRLRSGSLELGSSRCCGIRRASPASVARRTRGGASSTTSLGSRLVSQGRSPPTWSREVPASVADGGGELRDLPDGRWPRPSASSPSTQTSRRRRSAAASAMPIGGA